MLPSTISGYNFFTGSIPNTVITDLITSINFEFNYFTSSLPTGIGTLTRLNFVDFSGNYFTGSIPADFFPSKTNALWHYAHLFSNNLVGSLPDTVGNIIEIRDLLLHDNLFTGTIPYSLRNCTHLVSLLLQKNKLEGWPSVPFQQNPEAFYQLQTLDLSSNAFSGPIPTAFFRLPAVSYIASSQNCFDSELPSSICDATTLEQLYLEGLRSGEKCKRRIFGSLSSVYLSEPVEGGIPSCIWDMPKLRFLFLSGNLLAGSLPKQEQQNLSTLQYIGMI